ncbi:unnamed protein product, partial [marine sediment metagenome]
KLVMFESVYDNFKSETFDDNEELYVLKDLLDVTWHYLFMRIFQLKRNGGI